MLKNYYLFLTLFLCFTIGETLFLLPRKFLLSEKSEMAILQPSK